MMFWKVVQDERKLEEESLIELQPSPFDSILDAVLTVSPKRQYRGIVIPTTPATTGPKRKKIIKVVISRPRSFALLLHFQNQVTPCIVSNLLICSSAYICYFNNDKGRIVTGIDCSREINKKERIRFSGSLLKTRFLFGDFFFFILSFTTAKVACKTAIVFRPFRVLLPLLSVYYRYYILLSLSLLFLLLSLVICQLEKKQWIHNIFQQKTPFFSSALTLFLFLYFYCQKFWLYLRWNDA